MGRILQNLWHLREQSGCIVVAFYNLFEHHLMLEVVEMTAILLPVGKHGFTPRLDEEISLSSPNEAVLDKGVVIDVTGKLAEELLVPQPFGKVGRDKIRRIEPNPAMLVKKFDPADVSEMCR